VEERSNDPPMKFHSFQAGQCAAFIELLELVSKRLETATGGLELSEQFKNVGYRTAIADVLTDISALLRNS
jgi:hypothetical protein